MANQPALTRDEQWEKLDRWLTESIAAIQRGDLSRLPADFTGERGEAAVAAYETVRQAMEILEQWETMGL
ncbi:hypothetical protein CCAX7_002810 [Capsulimonas corticalis]|uniref:Uncharacterized protein n=1 Tax=Capsulimonas corticalis TaxID=2219043 RepID=A0A402CS25_9BACT|nr:hypothetical protein [Capsulimonas corticalis]BDI28230.1 hypothetical protein CCAX7_002810 [Capsulimonas corticalis]